jgi:hypothetical protein
MGRRKRYKEPESPETKRQRRNARRRELYASKKSLERTGCKISLLTLWGYTFILVATCTLHRTPSVKKTPDDTALRLRQCEEFLRVL